jgi:hypothetical protein
MLISYSPIKLLDEFIKENIRNITYLKKICYYILSICLLKSAMSVFRGTAPIFMRCCK